MKTVKVFIEKSRYGFSAYMDDNSLNYGCIGEGKTVEQTIEDFKDSYEEIKEYSAVHGEPVEEVRFDFCYDTASFLK